MLANLSIATNTTTLEVTSPAFTPNSFIPEQYTCDGINELPEINISRLPADTKSLAIIVDDPDGLVGTWVHWVAWNIHPKTSIKPNKIRAKQGINDFGMHKYCGPCPPNGIHHYHYKVYALDTFLFNLDTNCTKYQLEKAMSPHILAFGTLVGLYKRN
jgi:Raf kinase inhibitor-like YbhB/YbcL family protein